MSQKNKIAKFKSKHAEGRKKFAAQKAFDKQTKKQEKNSKRVKHLKIKGVKTGVDINRKGHTPKIRKIIK